MARHVRIRGDADPAYGCPPDRRPLGEYLRLGVVLLDKPSGPTSRRAAAAVADLLGVSKVGHGGTLDPKVTGVLPVLLGRSTLIASMLLGCNKAYEGTMALHGEATDEELERAMQGFRGTIEQMPPRRSRVKRRTRPRTVYAFERLERQGRSVEFSVECQAGTYVRKLIHDLGLALGCGAHMAGLRRTRAATFGLEECVTLERLRQAAEGLSKGSEGMLRRLVRPVEDVVSRLAPLVVVDDGAVQSVCTGFPLAVPGVCELDDFQRGERVAAMTRKGELVGVGEAALSSQEILRETHGVAVVVGRVLMDPGVYPKWRPPAAEAGAAPLPDGRND